MTKETKLFLAMLGAMTLWGGGWVALKILTHTVSFEVVTFWRFFIMFLSFLPFLLWMHKPIIIPKKSLGYIFGGALLNIAFMMVAFLGVKYGAAGEGSMIITTLSPLITFILAAWIFKKRLLKRQYVGLFLGLLGGVMMLQLHESLAAFSSYANLFYLLSALIWAVVTLLSQASHRYIQPVHYSFAISLIGTLVLLGLNDFQELLSVFDQGWIFWICLLYLGILGQTVATTIYYIASGSIGSGKASSFMFLVPFSAMLLSMLILDESVSRAVVWGGLISLVAVYLINKPAKA